MKARFFALIALFAVVCMGLFAASGADAQSLNKRVGKVSYYHATVGTTAAAGIAGASIGSNVVGWALCHDAASTSTYLAVGEAADPLTDGVRLAAGQCYECLSCTRGTLANLKVVGQAAGATYAIVQFRE